MTFLEKAICGLEKAMEDQINFNATGFSGPGHPAFIHNAKLRASYNILKQEAERIQAANGALVEAAEDAIRELQNHTRSAFCGVENASAVDAIAKLQAATAHGPQSGLEDAG